MRKEFAEFVLRNEKSNKEDQIVIDQLKNESEVNVFTLSSARLVKDLAVNSLVNVFEFRGSFYDIAKNWSKQFPKIQCFFSEVLDFVSNDKPVICFDFLNYAPAPIATLELIKKIFPLSKIYIGFAINLTTGVNLDQDRFIPMGEKGNIIFKDFNNAALEFITKQLPDHDQVINEDGNYVYFIPKKFQEVELKEEIFQPEKKENITTEVVKEEIKNSFKPTKKILKEKENKNV